MKLTRQEIKRGVIITQKVLSDFTCLEERKIPYSYDYFKGLTKEQSRKLAKLFYDDCGVGISKALKRYYYDCDVSSVTFCITSPIGGVDSNPIYQDGTPAPIYNFEVYMRDGRCWVLDPKISGTPVYVEKYISTLADLSNLEMDKLQLISAGTFQLNVIYKYADITDYGKITRYVDKHSGLRSMYENTYKDYVSGLDNSLVDISDSNKFKLVSLVVDQFYRDKLRDIFSESVKPMDMFEMLNVLRALWRDADLLTDEIVKMLNTDKVVTVV